MDNNFIDGYMNKQADFLGGGAEIGKLLMGVVMATAGLGFITGGGAGYLLGRTGGTPTELTKKELVKNELQTLQGNLKFNKELDKYKNEDNKDDQKEIVV